MSSSSSSSSSSGSGTMTTVISDAPTSTEFSFQWDIKSWSALDNRFGKGTSCKSVTGAGYTWNFLVFPGGNVNAESKDYVALFLVGKDVSTINRLQMRLATEHIITPVLERSVGQMRNTSWYVTGLMGQIRLATVRP